MDLYESKLIAELENVESCFILYDFIVFLIVALVRSKLSLFVDRIHVSAINSRIFHW